MRKDLLHSFLKGLLVYLVCLIAAWLIFTGASPLIKDLGNTDTSPWPSTVFAYEQQVVVLASTICLMAILLGKLMRKLQYVLPWLALCIFNVCAIILGSLDYYKQEGIFTTPPLTTDPSLRINLSDCLFEIGFMLVILAICYSLYFVKPLLRRQGRKLRACL